MFKTDAIKGLLYFGTATDNPANDAAYTKALSNSSDFGQITPANQQKWDAIEPDEGQFTFTRADAIVSLATENGQMMRCHNLVWHQQLPAWVTGGTWTKATLTAALQAHVTGEVTHYKGKCYAWDVVNEALNDDGTFRSDVFMKIIGEDYIRIAFEAAAAADPQAKLYYNDFSIETPSPKTTAALNIVKKLKAAGTKIDGVGFQSHFIVGSTPSETTQISNLRSFTALGVEVALTELDIRMKLPSTAASLSQQKTDYQTSISACVAVDGCVGITVWDFGDKYSWVPSTFMGFGSADLFDETVKPKPAYSGVAAGFTSSNTTSNGLAAIFKTGNKTLNGGEFVEIGTATGTLSSPKATSTNLFISAGTKSAHLLRDTFSYLFVLLPAYLILC